MRGLDETKEGHNWTSDAEKRKIFEAPLESLQFPLRLLTQTPAWQESREEFKSVLIDIGIEPTVLEDLDSHITGQQFKTLIEMGLDSKADNDPLSVQLGRYISIPAYGTYGFAIMSSSTLDDALNVALSYASLVMPVLVYKRRMIDGKQAVCMSCHPAMGRALPLIQEMGVMVQRNILALAESPIAPAAIFFSHNNEFSLSIYEEFFNCPVTFNCAETYVLYESDSLSTPMKHQDPVTAALLHRQLQEQYEKFLKHGQWSRKVHECFERAYEAYRLGEVVQWTLSRDLVAEQLNTSVKTLSRRLEDEGTGFQEISEDFHKMVALDLLRNSDMTVSEISYAVGFSDVRSFRRAFKRWTGLTPGSMRR